MHVCLRHRDRHASVNTPKKNKTEQNVRSRKSEAETNNRRLRSEYCTTDRHEASHGLSAKAGLVLLTTSTTLFHIQSVDLNF